jgi:hypothetical protein
MISARRARVQENEGLYGRFLLLVMSRLNLFQIRYKSIWGRKSGTVSQFLVKLCSQLRLNTEYLCAFISIGEYRRIPTNVTKRLCFRRNVELTSHSRNP